MADELKPCKYCGCDWGHTGECPLDSPGAVERARLKSENDALRAEVAALKAECAEAWRVHSEVVAELKAKLAKYTEPLTDNQVASLADDWALPNDEFKLIDAAIREVRGK